MTGTKNMHDSRKSQTGIQGGEYRFTQRKEEAQSPQRFMPPEKSVMRALRKLRVLCVNFLSFITMRLSKKIPICQLTDRDIILSSHQLTVCYNI
ncbi:hypothetical protein LH29_18395 [Draconibacterium sediminis]|uniref:Uncharacterized protein n=1 Tax=Draconibacterium sediminis TaxID=1544798 RepID=A0A0D8J6W1_9BACT|nr:hypothetical protein LH29_18395 [Draconibacterium sediminis]